VRAAGGRFAIDLRDASFAEAELSGSGEDTVVVLQAGDEGAVSVHPGAVAGTEVSNPVTVAFAVDGEMAAREAVIVNLEVCRVAAPDGDGFLADFALLSQGAVIVQ